MRPLLLVFVETALEPMPKEILNHPMILEESHKRHKPPVEILLDSNKHNLPMRALKQMQRRGRPDILHFSLLVALDSIAAKTGVLKKVLVHTQNDEVILFPHDLRLPRIYNRFCGIMEQLFAKGSTDLISIDKTKNFESFFEDLLKEEKGADIFLLNEEGKETNMKGFSKEVSSILKKKSAAPIIFVFGCFPHGHISPNNRKFLLKKKAKELNISGETLAVWTLVSMAVTIYELEAGL